MKKHFGLLFMLAVFSLKSIAAANNLPFGGRQAGMGNTGVSVFDFWAISHNQAGITKEKSITAGFCFTRPFMAKELSYNAIAILFPTASGVFGFNFTRFGYSGYNENKTSLAFARAFCERLSVGLQLNYHHINFGSNYGSASHTNFELGLIYELLPGLFTGVHLYNPTHSKVKDIENETAPVVMRLGFSYIFSEDILLSIETEKEMNTKPAFKAGLEYQIFTDIKIRAGLGTQPITNSFGIGIKRKNLILDIAAAFHNLLGYSPHLSIRYNFR